MPGIPLRPSRRPRGAGLLGRVLVAAGLAASAPASAHHRTSTFSDVRVDGADLSWRLRIRTADLAPPIGLSAEASVGEVRAHEAAVLDYVGRRVAVWNGAAACAPEGGREAGSGAGSGAGTSAGSGAGSGAGLGGGEVAREPAASEPSVAVVLRYRCPRRIDALRLRYELFFDLDPLHQGFARVFWDAVSQPSPAVFRVDLRELHLARDVPLWRAAADYLVLGLEHIFTGYDHLAFLAALLLAAAMRRRAGPDAGAEAASTREAVLATVKIVTAFTVAHSITLILAATGTVSLPTAFVEPAIALSVAYVGAENVLARVPRRRALLVFGFGLIHGLGFASVLREIGLPGRGLVLCLLAFNLGVELGQLTIVSVALPLLLAMARRRPAAYERWALRAGGAALAAAGLVWFVLRVR